MNAIASTVKGFFSKKFNIFLVFALLLLGILAYVYTAEAPEVRGEGLEVNFFYLPTCPHCAEQKPIIAELEQDMPDIVFRHHDASSQSGSQLFYQMANEAGLDTSRLGVPTTFIGKHALVGVRSKEEIAAAIDECEKNCKANGKGINTTQPVSTGFGDFELPFIGKTDLTEFSLPVLAIILGLIDGFNPCAMWVLVYLISLLIGVRDKRKIWIIVGSFLFASGALYFLFMAAWLNIFLLVGYIRILTLLIGLVALGGGVLNLKDYFTKKDALTCEVGDEESHEKVMHKIQKIIAKPVSIAIIFSIIALACVVNSVEFVCSSAIPAVFTQVLSLSGLSTLQHYLYILLYDFFFMLDDLVIFGLAAFAISSSLGDKYAKYCKLVGGLILTVLGVLLLFAPQLLR
jgi:thiol-disulfide isomerase/thioredoxin